MLKNVLKFSHFIAFLSVIFLIFQTSIAYCINTPAEGVILEKIKQKNSNLYVWVYYPQKKDKERIPVVLVPPAGSRLYHGMTVSSGDTPEHIPYVNAGFAVISFDISGSFPEKASNENIVIAAKQYMKSNAGVNNAKNALQLAMAKYPFLDPSKIYSAGHSSAGTLAITLAQHLSEIKACISYAPVTDVYSYLGDNLDFFEYHIPGFKDFIMETSPANNIDNINIPLFLFNSQDDKIVHPELMTKFVDKLILKKKNYTYKTTNKEGHYQSMITVGLPMAISWLKKVNDK